MHVAGAALATAIVVLLLVVQPSVGTRRYKALVAQIRADPGARVRFYVRGVVAQWSLVAVVAIVGALLGRGPASIRLTWHLATTTGSSIALYVAAGSVLGIGASIIYLRRSGPKAISNLRDQARRVVELLPRSTEERRMFVGVAVTAGVCEEIIYRGFGIAYVRWLIPGASSVAVILIIGAAFGAAHAYQGPRNIVVTGVLGGLLAWLTIATNSLLPAMAVHAAIDLRAAALPAGVFEQPEVADLHRTHSE